VSSAGLTDVHMEGILLGFQNLKNFCGFQHVLSVRGNCAQQNLKVVFGNPLFAVRVPQFAVFIFI
jgi:hypothetical protein